ncbi:hypothetical protein U0C82_16700 [Fulvimarina sp. 2208YS6-2-32]|uniref:DUF4131 domain-containing protein n=1 Tax=Fulvimarina uroteuthidis TaxID=3098149 RepID=A0ABU5I5Z6_9HYPH|nr:hypothetical protein [Fulvimarina sp. 2208YS6-2-32]MDY8110782.1 hypothetical protein [Fulvimarina sp. 2208YS6-2-32]
MTRNLDLIIRAASLPIVLAFSQARMFGLFLSVAILALAFTDVEIVRVVVYGIIALIASNIATIAAHWGSRFLAITIVVGALFAAWEAEYIFRMVIPTAESVRITDNVPISLSQSISGNTVRVSFTNLSAMWLESLRIECQGYYRDGTPREKPWGRNGAGIGHWLAPGDSVNSVRVFEARFDDVDRYDLNRSECRVAHADFRRMPEQLPRLETETTETGRLRFVVTNTTDYAIDGIWISCMTRDGFRTTVPVEPAYQSALHFTIALGSSITLMPTTARFGLQDCRIYALRAL